MKLHLVTVGTRMPDWVSRGYREYASRLPSELGLNLREIPAGRRGKGADLERILRQECERIRSVLPHGCCRVVLDVGGESWTTKQFAHRLQDWMRNGRDVALIVGGPDGLAPGCLDAAEHRWSLSPLTLPHPMVRIIVAEQLYRAWSLLRGHPYHR